MRLDRFLTQQLKVSNKEARRRIDLGLLTVDGALAQDWNAPITRFSEVSCDGDLLQANTAEYWMLHKPVGVVSDTKHPHHKTVLDCLDVPHKAELHVAGRLDLNTSGLVLLTNNGAWSKHLTMAASKVGKVYLVETDKPIPPEAAEVFQTGLYFAYEDITTLPAELEFLTAKQARLTLHEGRYHQVKRMFGALGLRVMALHREAIGKIHLDASLSPGEFRPLISTELEQ